MTKNNIATVLRKGCYLGIILVAGVISISAQIKIQWVSSLEGDYSFAEEWSYSEGIYLNEFGQLSCDGFCPEETYFLKDEQGRIFNDSLAKFYSLIDTTHLFHTLASDANMYEWADPDFILVKQTGKKQFLCHSSLNVATHSQLILNCQGNEVNARVNFNSIVANTLPIDFFAKSGTLLIDKKLISKGIFKAQFSFEFENILDPSKPLNWSGKILAPIQMN